LFILELSDSFGTSLKPNTFATNSYLLKKGCKSGYVYHKGYYTISSKKGKDVPKKAPSASADFLIGEYTSLQRGQYTFTLAIFKS
jgi:hypothetical protein